MKNEKNEKGIMCRNSTIRAEYIKRILEKNNMKLRDKEEHYKKYNIDIHRCVYCGEEAFTFDHIYGVVTDLHFSGYTNNISNLIPACSRCNSSKGKKDWDIWLETVDTEYVKKLRNKEGFEDRCKIIRNYIEKNETKSKKVDKAVLEKINNNADIFNKELEKRLGELNKLFIKHKRFYEDIKK